MTHYDIFISYRRSSYDTANLVATRLKAAGYSVFFDMETLRSGKFNEQLYNVIDNCTDFVVVLPPNALDRCVNEDDWVRLEVTRAMKGNKNIVPIMLNGFKWPNPMPNGLEELSDYQSLTASSVEYFDMAMERLQKRYLLSKPHFPIVKVLKYLGVALLALFSAMAIVWGVFMTLSRDVCTKYATRLTMDANNVHVIAEESDKLQKEWTTFNSTLNIESRPERIASLKESMLQRIDLAEESVRRSWSVDSVRMNIEPYHSFLLSINGINAEEIALSPEFATLYYMEYLENLNTIRNAVDNPITLRRRYVDALFEASHHSMNVYYVTMLSEISSFPKYARKTYSESSNKWIYFRANCPYELDRDSEYYENIMNTEQQLAEDALSRFENMLEQQDAQLEDIKQQNDNLERQVERGLSDLKLKADSAAMAAQAMAEIERIKRENEHELALRREKVEAKRVAVASAKAELEELDKEYVKTYESLKEKCSLEEENGQWYKWGKIRRWGSFLAMLVNSRQKLQSQGIYSTSSVTPEVAYADMNSMLAVYQAYHPESERYVASAKQFFRELSKGKRDYRGTIIFGFKDNEEHPFLRQGDIIVGYDGQKIKTYDDLKTLYQNNKSGQIAFLRLEGGEFNSHTEQIANMDIVGFLELTE